MTERAVGSEDFAFVSQRIPAIGAFLTVGDGGRVGLHHPMVRFDDTVMWRSSATYAYNVVRWLEEHRDL